ncbi:MAG: Two-component transcriptional response regulator, LuxR family [Nitrospira sp.]|jgi:two-component system chemotaxis response regulator CheY|nr:MAG: Two-component transcriptional response regulator, LuxR family [Nitrospira sp.]
MGMAWPFGLSTGDKVCLGRVLVVDDEAPIRNLLRMMLTHAGYDVEEAEDGGKAVEVLNSGDNPLMVDAVICDIRMPRINGMEAIAYFRAQYPSLPVIVLTGYHDEQLANSLLKQGVVEHLEKPAERERILSSVAQAIARRRISFYP